MARTATTAATHEPDRTDGPDTTGAPDRATPRRPLRHLPAAAALLVLLSTWPSAPDATAAPAAVRPGAFCKAADEGRTDTAADGRLMRCGTTTQDPRHRWREVVK